MIKIIEHDGSVNEYDEKDAKVLSTLRHTASHVMAQAIKRLYPNTKLAIGPVHRRRLLLRCGSGDVPSPQTIWRRLRRR